MKISVVIPTYNRAMQLRQAVESVLAQTHPVMEILVVDDGSSDGTGAELEAVRAKHQNTAQGVRYIRQENAGKSAALNRGLSYARGDAIAFLDDDDLWLPEKLAWQARALASFPECGACFTDVRFVNNPRLNRTIFEMCRKNYPAAMGKDDTVPSILSHSGNWSGVFMQTLLVRREALETTGEFDSTIRFGMDVDFVFRLSLRTPLCYVNQPLVSVDRTEARQVGLTTQYPSRTLQRERVHEELLRKWIRLAAQARPELVPGLRRKLTSTQSEIANHLILQKETRRAREVLWKAMRERFAVGPLAKWVLSYLALPVLQKHVRRRQLGPEG